MGRLREMCPMLLWLVHRFLQFLCMCARIVFVLLKQIMTVVDWAAQSYCIIVQLTFLYKMSPGNTITTSPIFHLLRVILSSNSSWELISGSLKWAKIQAVWENRIDAQYEVKLNKQHCCSSQVLGHISKCSLGKNQQAGIKTGLAVKTRADRVQGAQQTKVQWFEQHTGEKPGSQTGQQRRNSGFTGGKHEVI